MKYRLCIKITCPDVPPIEDIDEHLTVDFETNDKLEGIKRVLLAASEGWEDFQKKANSEKQG